MAYSTISKPSLHFNTKLYTGNAGTNAITGVGFQPDFTWLKNRSTSQDHELYDAVRTATKAMHSNASSDESTYANGLNAFGTDGFTVGDRSNINGSGNNICSWNWKAGGSTSTNSDGNISGTQSVNQASGFSVTTYTGNGGSNQSLGHGLGSTPKIYICKRRDNSGQWLFMNTLIDGTLDYLFLETTGTKSNSSRTAPTSSVVYLENGGDANESGGTHVMYAFAEKAGYSKFGSYVGNGNADGTFVYTGFKPAFVLFKATAVSGSHWYIWDNKRNTHNLMTKRLYPNLNNAEDDGTNNSLDFLSNGFKMKSTNHDSNKSGDSYIYMAFAEEPLVANVGASIPATAR
jgi:hypothetical protein